MGDPMEEIVQKLKFLRMGLVPPYCEDQDEDEKDADDYREHFASRLQECKNDAQRYLASVMQLAGSDAGDSAAVDEVLAARARFAASFPFCVDELASMQPDQAKPYVDHMAQAYRRDAAMGSLAKSLEQYIALLDELS